MEGLTFVVSFIWHDGAGRLSRCAPEYLVLETRGSQYGIILMEVGNTPCYWSPERARAFWNHLGPTVYRRKQTR